MALRRTTSLEEFLTWPETKPHVEFIDGAVRQKTMPDQLHSFLQALLAQMIGVWSGVQGFTLTEQRCILSAFGESHIVLPDVCWFSNSQLPVLSDGPVRSAPTLAVEIVSKDDSYADVEDKVMIYIAAGVPVVWVVDPRGRKVNVYRSPAAPVPLRPPAVLNDELLPGLHIPLADLFARLPEISQPHISP